MTFVRNGTFLKYAYLTTANNRIRLVDGYWFNNLPALKTLKLSPDDCFLDGTDDDKPVHQVLSRFGQKCAPHSAKDLKKIGCHVFFLPLYGFICIVDTRVEINSNNFEMVANGAEHIHHLLIAGCEGVEYLPLSTEFISHLIEYWAPSCRITAISKENFVNMKWLSDLALSGNEITTIDSDTFTGLESLKNLALGEVN